MFLTILIPFLVLVLIIGAVALVLPLVRGADRKVRISPIAPDNQPVTLDFAGIPMPATSVKRRTMDVFDDEHGMLYSGFSPFGRRHGNIAHVESDGMLP